MGALTDLWKSERGLVAIALIACATVLAGLGQIQYSEWREYTIYVFGIYVGGKTLTSAATIIKGGEHAPPIEPEASSAKKRERTTTKTGG